LVGACGDAEGVTVIPLATLQASVSIEAQLERGETVQVSRTVRQVQGGAGQFQTMALTDSAVQISHPVKSPIAAPIGTTVQVLKSMGGINVRAFATRSIAGAPVSRVEVRDGEAFILLVESNWVLTGDRYILASRTYERFTAGGRRVQSTVAFGVTPTRPTLAWSASLSQSGRTSGEAHSFTLPPSIAPFPVATLDDGCGDGGGGVIRAATHLHAALVDCEESGCFLKGVQVGLAAAAASLLLTGTVINGLATLATGGFLAPAEVLLVAGYLAAEVVYFNRLDLWLECMYP